MRIERIQSVVPPPVYQRRSEHETAAGVRVLTDEAVEFDQGKKERQSAQPDLDDESSPKEEKAKNSPASEKKTGTVRTHIDVVV